MREYSKITSSSPVLRTLGEWYKENSKWYIFLLVLWIVITTVITSIEPIFMSKVIAYIEEFYKTWVFNTESFLYFIGIWGIYILLSACMSYIHRYYISDVPALEFHNTFSYKYLPNVFYMTFGTYLTKKMGSIYKNFDKWATSVFQLLFTILKDFLKTIISLIVVLWLLLTTNWQMTLLTLSMLPFMAITGYITHTKTRIPQKENSKKWNAAFGFMGDFLSSMQLGKILRLEKEYIMRFHSELEEAKALQLQISKGWALNDLITSFFVMISRFLVLGYGVYSIAHHTLTLSELMLVFSLIGMIYYPLGYIFWSLGNFQKINENLRVFYEEFDELPLETIEPHEMSLKEVKWKIEFRDVHFGYNSSKKIFSWLSFVISPGEKIAFVGDTGAGKSTIISLLFRFWDPESGSIFLDGEDIKHISRNSLRSHIGLVAQDSSLFNVSIRENLLFVKPEATEQEIHSALTNASADFALTLPEWLDTIIGERGLKLSGWEKQRIALARVFLQNPEVLVLDEATSALDTVTEKRVQLSLERLLRSKTSIIIAHRLSTIKHVDRIFVLEKGTIIESGTYEELLRNNGKFASLVHPDKLTLS